MCYLLQLLCITTKTYLIISSRQIHTNKNLEMCYSYTEKFLS